jgi:hypothetical protein
MGCYAAAAVYQRRSKSHSGLEKATRDMNFSAMELYTLIHDLKQQR